MENKFLQITIDRVQEAAKSCPDAKNVLRKLFPEAFEEPSLIRLEPVTAFYSTTGHSLIEVRNSGRYRHKAFYLDTLKHEWEMKVDDEKVLVLIPKPKYGRDHA